MSLKWNKNKPDTKDVCTVVSTETKWNYEIEYAEGETDLDVTLCYDVALPDTGIVTSVKIECKEWFAPCCSVGSGAELFDFIGDAIDEFYSEEADKGCRDNLTNAIYSTIEKFCAKNEIDLPV